MAYLFGLSIIGLFGILILITRKRQDIRDRREIRIARSHHINRCGRLSRVKRVSLMNWLLVESSMPTLALVSFAAISIVGMIFMTAYFVIEAVIIRFYKTKAGEIKKW